MKKLSLFQSTALLRSETSVEKAQKDFKKYLSLLPYSNSFTEGTELNLESFTTANLSHLAGSVIKKLAPTGAELISARETAKQDFLSAEHHCGLTNSKLKSLRQSGENPYLQSVLLTAQYDIGKILGPFDPRKMLDFCRWGPRSTSSCRYNSSTAAHKFAARLDVTSEFLYRARILLPLFPSWSAVQSSTEYGVLSSPLLSQIRGNKITFVPKTSKTHRTIAVEPHVNSFFQNGLGRYMRDRMLKRAHLDLSDQTLNQRLACLGSKTNDLATIDLSQASDTICTELVRDLLPIEWFSWCDSARSHSGTLDNEVIRYQKFSSMGNGFTFDLESLIFYSLVKAVCTLEGFNPFWVNVFGDDIVCPSGIYDKVVEVLTSVGFKINFKKSFHDSPFRESCGKDYYKGVDIRPFFIKKVPVTPMDWIQICNKTRLYAHKHGGWFCCKSLKSAYEFSLSRVPRNLRKRVPLGAGDVGIISNLDEAVPNRHSSWDCYVYSYFQTVPKKQIYSGRALLTAGVYQLSQTGGFLTEPDNYMYREATTTTHEWYDLGPWY